MSEDSQKLTKSEQMRTMLEDTVFAKGSWEGRGTDGLLQWFVQFTNNTLLEVSVTLTVGGNLISGSLISSTAYFEQLASDFSTPFNNIEGVEPEQIKTMILAMAPEPDPEGTYDFPYQFIHLRNAKVYSGTGGAIVSPGSLWRGRITAIDGFSLGSITQSE